MENLRKISYLFVLLAYAFSANSQETVVTRDLEQWTSLGISKKINKHWKLSLYQDFRIKQDISEFDIYFTDLGIDYKINKHFEIGANYRFYQNKNAENMFVTQHRFSTDFKFKQKINRFSLAYRIRLQNKDEDFFITESDQNIFNIRNKFSLDYNIKDFKFDPYLDVELYRRINSFDSNELSKLRWTLGVEYSIKKVGDVGVFYRLDNDLHMYYTKNTYIVGIGYKFSF